MSSFKRTACNAQFEDYSSMAFLIFFFIFGDTWLHVTGGERQTACTWEAGSHSNEKGHPNSKGTNGTRGPTLLGTFLPFFFKETWKHQIVCSLIIYLLQKMTKKLRSLHVPQVFGLLIIWFGPQIKSDSCLS